MFKSPSNLPVFICILLGVYVSIICIFFSLIYFRKKYIYPYKLQIYCQYPLKTINCVNIPHKLPKISMSSPPSPKASKRKRDLNFYLIRQIYIYSNNCFIFKKKWKRRELFENYPNRCLGVVKPPHFVFFFSSFVDCFLFFFSLYFACPKKIVVVFFFFFNK